VAIDVPRFKYGLAEDHFDGNFTREEDFEERLANILSVSYEHEVTRQVRYKSDAGNGRLDLYLILYSWRHPKWKECNTCESGNGHVEATELFEKVLMKVGCSLIRSNGYERGFLSNRLGPEKWFGLGRVS
jgi:hypothetical protein